MHPDLCFLEVVRPWLQQYHPSEFRPETGLKETGRCQGCSFNAGLIIDGQVQGHVAGAQVSVLHTQGAAC